jgi:quercetin dioxygenase-like cupin family protein
MQNAHESSSLNATLQAASSNELLTSRVFHFGELPAHKVANGSESRNVLHGRLATGEWVAVHESVQPAGTPPNPAHRIQHTEVFCVREGAIEFLHDGVTERASAGDILFIANGTMHGICNVGDGPAAYFVVAIGGDINR